jgi:hypothetical protein
VESLLVGKKGKKETKEKLIPWLKSVILLLNKLKRKPM